MLHHRVVCRCSVSLIYHLASYYCIFVIRGVVSKWISLHNALYIFWSVLLYVSLYFTLFRYSFRYILVLRCFVMYNDMICGFSLSIFHILRYFAVYFPIQCYISLYIALIRYISRYYVISYHSPTLHSITHCRCLYLYESTVILR